MTIETPPSHLGRLDNIQALRGLAAILVVFCHIADHQRRYVQPGSVEWDIASGFWDQGWIGVDLFFVISGYIMVHVTRNVTPGLASSGQFLFKRITRIYPLWWLCAGLMALYFIITYGVPAAPDVVPDPRENWAYVGKSLLLIPQADWPSLGVGWTLIHEMFFYLVFAGLLLLARSRLVLALLIWAALTIASNVIFGSMPRDKPVLLVMTSLMSLQFIAGALLAVYLPTLADSARLRQVSWAGIALSVLFLIWALFNNPEVAAHFETNHVSRTIVYTVPFTVILGATTYLYRQGRLHVPKALSVFGDWSYSLYLTHILVLIGLTRILRIMEPSLPKGLGDLILVQRDGWINNLLMAGVALLLCIVVAAIFYYGFERPVTRLFRRGRGRSRERKSG